MAQLPPVRRIFREDLGGEAPSWITRLLSPLNGFLEAVYSALNKNLTFSQNFRAQIKEFSVLAGALAADNTFSFPVEFPAKPIGLSLLQVNAGDGTPLSLTAAVGVSWNWDSQSNTIQITAITGLTSGQMYQIRVLVI